MKFIFIFLMCLSGMAYAGGVSIIGNGGDVVACVKSDGRVSAEVLDLYEAKILLGLTPQWGGVGNNVEKRVLDILSRMDLVSPKMTETLKLWVQTFFQEALFLSEVNLVDIPDSSHIVLPKNCQIQQVVNQRVPNTPNEKRYIISKDLWDLLDDNNKITLILHEVIYRYFIQLGHENSVGARLFNAYIISDSFKALSLMDRLSLLIRIKMPMAYVQGVYIKLYHAENSIWKLSPLEFYPNGALRRAIVEDYNQTYLLETILDLTGEIIFYPSGKIFSSNLAKDVWVNYEGQNILLKAGYFELYESGKIKKANFGNPIELSSDCFKGKVWGEIYLSEKKCPLVATNASGMVYINNRAYQIQYGTPIKFNENGLLNFIYLKDAFEYGLFLLTSKIIFHSNGNPESASLMNDQAARIQNKNILLSRWGLISFFENGTIKKACTQNSINLSNVKGSIEKVSSRQYFELNAEGLLMIISDHC